jgi:hypothetical protein
MRKIARTTAIVGTAALLSVTGTAWAAGPYTVTAGTQTSGNVDVHGTSVGTLTFAGPSSSATCKSGTASGSVTLGPSDDGVGIGSIDDSTWDNCTGDLGEVVITQTAPWRLNATGAPTDGVTAVTVDQVAVHVTSGSCSFDATGSADGFVDESDQTLHITPPTDGAKVVVSNTSWQCLGVVADGDEGTITATYAVTNSSDGDLQITSP